MSQLTLEDAEEYYSIAGSLEGLAARLPLARGSAEELSRLENRTNGLSWPIGEKFGAIL